MKDHHIWTPCPHIAPYQVKEIGLSTVNRVHKSIGFHYTPSRSPPAFLGPRTLTTIGEERRPDPIARWKTSPRHSHLLPVITGVNSDFDAAYDKWRVRNCILYVTSIYSIEWKLIRPWKRTEIAYKLSDRVIFVDQDINRTVEFTCTLQYWLNYRIPRTRNLYSAYPRIRGYAVELNHPSPRFFEVCWWVDTRIRSGPQLSTMVAATLCEVFITLFLH